MPKNLKHPIDTPKVDPTNSRPVKKTRIAKDSEKIRHRKVTLSMDCIYRSHINPERIFGDDVSFCYGRYATDLNHYKLAPFSEFAEGCFLFELSIVDDINEFLDYVNPIEHHPGAGRGFLPADGLIISRVFYDPKDFEVRNNSFEAISLLQKEQFANFGAQARIKLVRINRAHLIEHMSDPFNSSVSLKIRLSNPSVAAGSVSSYSPSIFSSAANATDPMEVEADEHSNNENQLK
jgi:hypothetical protein